MTHVLIISIKALIIVSAVLLLESATSFMKNYLLGKGLRAWSNAHKLYQQKMGSLILRHFLFLDQRKVNITKLLILMSLMVLLLIGVGLMPFSEEVYINQQLIEPEFLKSSQPLIASMIITLIGFPLLAILVKSPNKQDQTVELTIGYPIVFLFVTLVMAYEYGSVQFNEIIQAQLVTSIFGVNVFGLVLNPATFAVYFLTHVMMIKDLNRDLSDQGLTSAKTLIIRLHVFFISSLGVMIFLGGYGLPWEMESQIIESPIVGSILSILIFLIKVKILTFASVWFSKRQVLSFDRVKAYEINNILFPSLALLIALSVAVRFLKT